MRKETKRNSNRLTEEDLKDGEEFNKIFCSLNSTGRLLVTTFMAGLKGSTAIGTKDKKAG